MSRGNKHWRTRLRQHLNEYHADKLEERRIRKLREAEAARKAEDVEDAWDYWRDPHRDWDDYDHEWAYDYGDRYEQSKVHPTEAEWRAVIEMDYQKAHLELEKFRAERMENLSSAPVRPSELVAVLRAVCVFCEENDRYGNTILDTDRFTVLADELVQKLLVSLGYEQVVDYINSQKSRCPW